MIEFVGIPIFLKMALRVAMATMHFHIAQTGLFLGTFFLSHSGDPRAQFSTHENCPGSRVGQIGCRGRKSPVENGWSMTDSGLTPSLMTQSMAPKELTELTICQCQQLNLPLVHSNM